MKWYLVVLVGAFTGLLGGLFGKGGAAVATPLLALVGVKPFAAVASPLPATIPATLIAAAAYWKAREIDVAVLRPTIAWGIPATVGGALLTTLVGGAALVVACDVLVALLGVRILVNSVRGARAEPSRFVVSPAVVGIVVGLISGLLGNSGGFLLAPLFITVLHLPTKRALGTSLAAAAALAIPGTIVHAALGHIDWAVAVPFGLASIPLSALGARLALRTDAHRLERSYGAALILLGGTLGFVH